MNDRTQLLEKGTALSQLDRERLGVLGMLPFRVEHLADQVNRCYQQFSSQTNALQKNRYLRHLLDAQETVFYALVQQHLKEVLPIIYTPTVGEAVLSFNQAFLRPRGLFIAVPDQEKIDQILAPYAKEPIDVAVLSDGERVLGLGDQGIGSMEICIAKSLMYVVGGGLSPRRILPICLDVGTDNPLLLNDAYYLGWRHERIQGQDYENFIDRVVYALKKRFPHIYLHWEDLGRHNARNLLKRYQSKFCTFNDDMQGTGVVTLATALAAVETTGTPLTAQRVFIYGAGTAGMGIADQLCDAMQRQGLTQQQAQARFWLFDRSGLLMEDSPTLTAFQKPYAKPSSEKAAYLQYRQGGGAIDLLTAVRHAKPTFLIGCSGQGGAFNELIVRTLAEQVKRPIIFPLSNPTEKSEAVPADLLRWTNGQALIATGSPFEKVDFQGRSWPISQCNNALVFPGIALGLKASRAKQLTDSMLWAACLALRDLSPLKTTENEGLLPDVSAIQAVSQKIAKAVAQAACEAGVAQIEVTPSDMAQRIRAELWQPIYSEAD
jgi:malate dehydrogenase (oxaloacetate-decarboxylating)